jgi:hypothetical protein
MVSLCGNTPPFQSDMKLQIRSSIYLNDVGLKRSSLHASVLKLYGNLHLAFGAATAEQAASRAI